MKTFLVVLICAMALRAAGAAAGTAPFAIPAGAAAVESNAYRYTDAQGKAWIYYRTPFGVARVEAAAGAGGNIKAADDGDSVRFERQGPFGVCRWRTSKSRLDAEEQAAWARRQASAAAGRD